MVQGTIKIAKNLNPPCWTFMMVCTLPVQKYALKNDPGQIKSKIQEGKQIHAVLGNPDKSKIKKQFDLSGEFR